MLHALDSSRAQWHFATDPFWSYDTDTKEPLKNPADHEADGIRRMADNEVPEFVFRCDLPTGVSGKPEVDPEILIGPSTLYYKSGSGALVMSGSNAASAHGEFARGAGIGGTFIDSGKMGEPIESGGWLYNWFSVLWFKACLAMDDAKKSQDDQWKKREAIVQGLLRGRVVWANNCCWDLLFHLKRRSILLGMLFCHELHPFMRGKRLFVFGCNCCAGFGLATLCCDELFTAFVDSKFSEKAFRDVIGEKPDGIEVLAASVVVAVLTVLLNCVAGKMMTCSCLSKDTSSIRVEFMQHCATGLLIFFAVTILLGFGMA